MEGEHGTATIERMPPPIHSKDARSGEMSVLREAINHAVKEAMKDARDEDSGITRGVECDSKNCEPLQKLVSELRAVMLSTVADLRQDLMERLGKTETDLRTMVREEMATIRVQVTTMDNNLRAFQGELHQGDTQFAVVQNKLATMQSEIDRVRDGSTTTRPAMPAPREASTDKHIRQSPGEKGLVKSPTGNIILTAILTAVGTTLGMWSLSLMTRGAAEVVKDVAHEERSKANKPTNQTPPALPAPTAASAAP
jgi:hypothetical protein